MNPARAIKRHHFLVSYDHAEYPAIDSGYTSLAMTKHAVADGVFGDVPWLSSTVDDQNYG